jgi:hypothetical protein
MTKSLLTLIHELQALETLKGFSLAGGTNLAIRFKHRNSIDIDLFTPHLIGIDGWNAIQQALHKQYGSDILFCNIINEELGDQFCFLRALIKKGKEQIKVEMIQNVQHLDAIETIDGLNLFSMRDIGLFKLMAASNRFAKKDIYDLDHITDQIALESLLQSLKEKTVTYTGISYQCLFDLDHQKDPLDDVKTLLAFDTEEYKRSDTSHNHSDDRLDILENSKPWLVAKASWRKKVRGISQL